MGFPIRYFSKWKIPRFWPLFAASAPSHPGIVSVPSWNQLFPKQLLKKPQPILSGTFFIGHIIVVYFNQRLGAAHSKCQSKSSFLHYSRRKA